jgi:hypothetical protein
VHGTYSIYRKIPYLFPGKKIRINLISVRDSVGRSIPVEEEDKHDYYVHWKIGNPQEYVQGTQLYDITYEVKNAINYFKEHDEIYWNVTLGEWKWEIKNVSCIVNLPEGVDSNKVKWTFYTGKKGSLKQEGKALREGNKIIFTAGPFNVGEGLTIVVRIPKGVLVEPPWITRNWGYVVGILLPLITLFFMLKRYFEYGRDPKVEQSIMVEYEPIKELKPAEMGVLIDEKVDERDIIATIVDFAVRGYIKIKCVGYDYEIEFLRDGNDLEGYERTLFEGLKNGAYGPSKNFTTLSNIIGSFHEYVSQAKDELYDSLVKKGYFDRNPEKTRYIYKFIGITIVVLVSLLIIVRQESPILLLLIWFLFLLRPLSTLLSFLKSERTASKFLLLMLELLTFGSVVFMQFYFFGHYVLLGITDPMNILFLGILLSAAIVALIGSVMPRKTIKGVRMLKRVLGFKEFIERVEKDRERNPRMFEKILPYVIIFKIKEKWVSNFGDFISYISRDR